MDRRLIAFVLLTVLAGCEQQAEVNVTTRRIASEIHVRADSAGDLVRPMQFEVVTNVRSLRTPWDKTIARPTSQESDDGGQATFRIRAPSAGNYTLYGRVFWVDNAGNSFWVRVDDGPWQRFGNDGREGEWIYWKGPAWPMAAGNHTLAVRCRERGACVAEWFLSPVPDYITRATEFSAGRFTATQPAVLVDPAIDMTSDQPRFSVFFVSADGEDIRLGRHMAPDRMLTIRSPDGQVAWAGPVPVGHEALVEISSPREGDYTIELAGRAVRWQWLKPRFERLKARLDALQAMKGTSADFRFWLPTLVLCRDNIVRGWRNPRVDEQFLPSLPYVLDEFDKAERIATAMERGDYSGLDQPGGDERASFSEVDGNVCPYMLYLPPAYFKTREKMPLVLYLHGANGTQWELSRDPASRPWKIEDCRWPVVAPFARGNSGYAGPAEKDLLQLLTELQAHYRIDSRRLVVAGFSMGGGGTWRLALGQSDLFDAAIPIAGYWPRNGEARERMPIPAKLRPRIFIVHSPQDKTVPFTEAEAFRDALTKRKIPFKFIEYTSGHSVYGGIIDLLNSLYP